MRFLCLTVAYDGTDFSGWQWQPECRTVQGVMEAAITEVTGETVRVVSSGRTDAGVHALGQVVSMSTGSRHDSTTLMKALNANLPRDVAVHEVREACHGFNAIDDAVAKLYRYVIQDEPLQDVFSRRFAWHLRTRLDCDAMRTAVATLVGEHDFKSYESAGSQRVSTVRTIRSFTVARSEYQNGERLLIEVEADGFLNKMVRNLVGTLIEVGKGWRPSTWPQQILAARDRRQAGMTAPAQGLFLVRVQLR